MDRQQHWEDVYRSKPEAALSWHQHVPDTSIALLEELAPQHDRSVIDVGGGSSSLAGSLLDAGFSDVAVLDISQAALDRARSQLAERAERVRWFQADVTRADSLGQWDLWHDRAVFHFLTESHERDAYVRLARTTVPPGGHVVIATFSESGPPRCSGLTICRYTAEALAAEFADGFRLVRDFRQVHTTPWGAAQDFLWAVLQRT